MPGNVGGADDGEPRTPGAMRGRPALWQEPEPEGAEPRNAGQKPDFRIVQPEYVQSLGKTVYKDVGAMWKNKSKAGNEFYTLKIGKLKLLVFVNVQPPTAAAPPNPKDLKDQK